MTALLAVGSLHRLDRRRSDAGSMLPLLAGFAALGLTVVLLVGAATSLYVEHKRLLSFADAAALVGAEAFDLTDVVVDGDDVFAVLDPVAVREAVEVYTAAVPHRFEGVEIVDATTRDGRAATVTLRCRWRPPVVGLFIPDGVTIEVTATARSSFE